MDDIEEVRIVEVNNLNINQLQEKIAQLATTEDGVPLRTAMDDLKKALKENPAACSLLLPTDIGECVAALKRLTNKEILADLAKKPSERKKKGAGLGSLTKEELESISPEDLE